MGAMYMECSSKEMSGVHEIFDTAIDIAVRGQDEEYEAEQAAKKGGSAQGSGMPAKRKKKSSCRFL